MDASPLIDALVISGSLAALIASILAIYMVTLSLRVYRLTLTAYTNVRDALMQMAIQTAEVSREPPAKQSPPEEGVQAPKPEPSKEMRKEPYDTISSLLAGENLKAALIFDESGQVIEYEGDMDANREAALLTEIMSSLQLARSSVSSLQIQDGDLEVIMPTVEIAGRRTYFYARVPQGREGVDFELLRQSVKRILGNLLGGG
ncbi:MAG: hypothetical protein QXO86_01550 [Nitrososphaerota archaeon]